MPNKILNSDSEEDDDNKVELKINDRYADRYNTWREKEEMQKCELGKLLTIDI